MYTLLAILLMKSFFIHTSASVTNEQLSNFMLYLWNYDNNAAPEITVHLQGQTNPNATSDKAPISLFEFDTYYSHLDATGPFIYLLDNYNHVLGEEEHSTYGEDNEVARFLNESSKTLVMKKTLQFLHQHGYVEHQTWSYLETELRRIWFGFYPRNGHVSDSSGFEHVFVGETDSKGVVGFHNWIQFEIQEREDNLDYMGYIFSKEPNLIGVHFKWLTKTKPSSSFIYGSSPEFDMAMYTVCFLVWPNQKCNFSIKGNNIQVTTSQKEHNAVTALSWHGIR